MKYFSLIRLVCVWKAYWFLTSPFFSRTTLGLSLATWVLPASHQQMVLTLMPPCSSPLLFFSPHSSLVISWQQPLRRRRHRHLLPYRLRSQSLLRATLPLVILSASQCSSSRGTFSSPLHRYIAFSSSNFRELDFNFVRRDFVRTCEQNLSAIFLLETLKSILDNHMTSSRYFSWRLKLCNLWVPFWLWEVCFVLTSLRETQ